MQVIITCKYETDRMKNSREKVETITVWELFVAMETRVLIRSGPMLLLANMKRI